MGSFLVKAEAVLGLEGPSGASNHASCVELEHSPGGGEVRLVPCPIDQLRSHPSYARHNLSLPADRLSALAKLGDLAFRYPLVITQDRMVLDGYARWELARRQGRSSLPCIEYNLSEDEALRWLIQHHHRSSGLNDFCRILLALDREPALRDAARTHQQAGGEGKGSSKLTEAQRHDVRQQVARTAGVSVGNVSKVKELLTKAIPEILASLKGGEIRIHRGWLWCRLSSMQQRAALERYQSERGVGKAIRSLLSRHKTKEASIMVDKGDLVRLLRCVESGTLDPVNLFTIDTPGKTIVFTEELVRSLGSQKELLPCVTNNP